MGFAEKDLRIKRVSSQGCVSPKNNISLCTTQNSVPISQSKKLMTVKELEAQLLVLSPSEKAEVIQLLTRSINTNVRGITKTTGVCGGDACIEGTRIPVWLLVSFREQGASDANILDSYPHLSAVDLVNVWAYAEAYPDEIEEAIRQQEEADEILDNP